MQGLDASVISSGAEPVLGFWSDVYDGSQNSSELTITSTPTAAGQPPGADASLSEGTLIARTGLRTLVAADTTLSLENTFSFNPATWAALWRVKSFRKGGQVLAFAGINSTVVPRSVGIAPFLFNYSTFGGFSTPVQLTGKTVTHASNPSKCVKLEVVDVAPDKFLVYGTVHQQGTEAFVGQACFSVTEAFSQSLHSIHPAAPNVGSLPFGGIPLGTVGLTRIVRHEEDNFVVCAGIFPTPSAPIENFLRIWLCEVVSTGTTAAVLVGSDFNVNSLLPPDPNTTNSRFYAPELVRIPGTDLLALLNRTGVVLFRIDTDTADVTVLDTVLFAPAIPSSLVQNQAHLKVGFSNSAGNNLLPHSAFTPLKINPNIQEIVVSFTNGAAGSLPFAFNDFHLVLKIDLISEKVSKVVGPFQSNQNNSSFSAVGPNLSFSENRGIEIYHRIDSGNLLLSGMIVHKE